MSRAAPRSAPRQKSLPLASVHEATSHRVSIASPPGSSQARTGDGQTLPPLGRRRPGGARPASRPFPGAARTGVRAAAGTGASATALTPSGSGRRHGSPSSLPAPAERGRGRPVPGGSEAASAASPARTPLQGRTQKRAEGNESDQCRGNPVPTGLVGVGRGRGRARTWREGQLRAICTARAQTLVPAHLGVTFGCVAID